MCYYDQQLWPCGWWRWGQFRQQCEREHRVGETCGLKLIFQTYVQRGLCQKCDQMVKKQRRVRKMRDDVERWRREGNRRATIEKTRRDMAELAGQIDRMWREHETRKNSTNY
ncbi:hypothetical protein N658DRAFT_509939 [Parathielavia hyrcaniae]|uniref:Uncharacterized protein n=1 Tax=Parathielavia hyrcaniae TaxID=113614 RepID=A0AAN6SY11_9PEZI|nr:hypothetical protein N658DRAFT_509939 [Parathielavia hyrcaniae]